MISSELVEYSSGVVSTVEIFWREGSSDGVGNDCIRVVSSRFTAELISFTLFFLFDTLCITLGGQLDLIQTKLKENLNRTFQPTLIVVASWC